MSFLRRLTLTIAFGASLGVAVVLVRHALATLERGRVDRELQTILHERLAAESVLASPRSWTPRRSTPGTTLRLLTSCAPSSSSGGYGRSLHYQLVVESTNADSLRRLMQRRRPSLASLDNKTSRRMAERVELLYDRWYGSPFPDTVAIISLLDPSGFERLRVPVLANDVTTPAGETGTLAAAGSGSASCDEQYLSLSSFAIRWRGELSG